MVAATMFEKNRTRTTAVPQTVSHAKLMRLAHAVVADNELNKRRTMPPALYNTPYLVGRIPLMHPRMTNNLRGKSVMAGFKQVISNIKGRGQNILGGLGIRGDVKKARRRTQMVKKLTGADMLAAKKAKNARNAARNVARTLSTMRN